MNDISTLARLSPHVQEISLDFLDEVAGGKTVIQTTGTTTVGTDGTVTIKGGTTTITVTK